MVYSCPLVAMAALSCATATVVLKGCRHTGKEKCLHSCGAALMAIVFPEFLKTKPVLHTYPDSYPCQQAYNLALLCLSAFFDAKSCWVPRKLSLPFFHLHLCKANVLFVLARM